MLEYSYVTITVAPALPDPVDHTITVLDHYSRQPIENAAVTLEGIFAGYTNADGQLTFQDVIPGQTYPVLITAAGYQDSDQDIIANDEITIPTEDN